MKKRLLALLLALAMVVGYMPAIPAMADEDGAVDAVKPALTIYYTNDVHTYIKDAAQDGNMSYATLAQLKKDKIAAEENVLLLDAGDHAQGTAYGSMDKGEHIIQFMNATGYDAATLGNHEFDYGMEQALANVEAAEYPYLSSNFYEDVDQDGTQELVLAPYKIFEEGDLKVAVVGVTTPETYTKSTPAYFQNEDGEYIYYIKGGTDGQDLYDAVQAAIDAAVAEGANLVIGLGHLGIDASSTPWTSEEVIEHVTGFDAFIDGHSHSAVPSEVVTDKAGNAVVLTQTGEKLGKIGQMTITAEGEIQTELITSDVYDPEVNAAEVAWMAEINEQLGTEIAESDIAFTTKYADTSVRAIRQAETNLGNLNADAYYYYINEEASLDCDVALMNGGGIRADVAPGVWTYNTAKTVNTFGNVLCLMEVPGQMLLDALEWGAKDGGSKENGGFLHPAGLTYQIDDSIESTVQKDENGVWIGGPTGEYRVHDVKVYNKETGKYDPLDVNKMYKLGGANYTLRQQGDGFNMFQEADGMTLIMEGISEDYLAMSAYISAFTDTDDNGLGNIATANSPLNKYAGYVMNYEDPAGSDRVVYDGVLNIYYTNDVHTYIKDASTLTDKGKLQMSYATVSQLKKDKLAAGQDTLLLDAGDHVQGTAYGSMDNGEHIIQFMNAAGYDAATLGNHEFDYGMKQALKNVEAAEYPYLSANFYEDLDLDGESSPVLDPYKIFEVGGKKVAVVGITTPETYTKSTPAYFQNEEGEYIYDIKGGTDGQDLYDSVQAAIDAAYEAGADMVIALGHLGVDASSTPWTSEEVIANVSGLSAFIDGHSHSSVPSKVVVDKDEKNVILTQTGNYLNKVGHMVIYPSGKIQTALIVSDAYDAELNAQEVAWMAEIDTQLGTKIAESDIDFTINYEGTETRAIRQAETNLGNLNADAYYYYINEVANLDCDVAFMNGGGIRANTPAGDWTYKTAKTINTFGNVLCLMEVPGQMILDALEWGAQTGLSGESGGFLHPAGLTYKIDDSIPCTVQKDATNIWTGGPTGEYRVYDVQVYNKETGVYEALDVNKTYRLGGANYTLRNQGDGFNMFQEANGMTLVMEGICEDYMAMSTYVAAFADTDDNGYGNIASANSPLAAYEGYVMNYESATGAGRIVYEEKPVDVPAEVTATAKTPTSVQVTWDAVKDADSYTVWYAKKGTAKGDDSWKYVVTKKTSVTITGLKASTTYDIFVSPKVGTQETYLEKVQVTTLKALAAPKAKVALTSYKKVKVSWGKVANAASYKVLYKKASASKWSSKKTTKTSLTLNLTAGTKYQIKVVAVASAGKYESEASAVKTVTTLKKLAAPKVVKNKNKVKVTFENIAGETGYQISVSTKKTGTNIKATVKSTKATSKVFSVKKGKKLYYKVRAYKTVNGKKITGPWSKVKAFTLK